MGVILGSGVVPIALCITWHKANKWGCIAGSIAGFAAGIIAWLVTTTCLNGGVIDVTVSLPFLFFGAFSNVHATLDKRRCVDWLGHSIINLTPIQ